MSDPRVEKFTRAMLPVPDYLRDMVKQVDYVCVYCGEDSQIARTVKARLQYELDLYREQMEQK
jgi:hypothetical protein